MLDVGSSNSGLYELHAVLTHKGRSSSSGHYVAWVRKSGRKADTQEASKHPRKSILVLCKQKKRIG